MLRTAQHSHPAPNSLKMQQKLVLSGTRQTPAIRQKKPISFPSATVTWATHTMETCRQHLGAGHKLVRSLLSPFLLSSLSPPLACWKPRKKTSTQHLRAIHTSLGAEHHVSPHWKRLSRSQQQFWCVPHPSSFEGAYMSPMAPLETGTNVE